MAEFKALEVPKKGWYGDSEKVFDMAKTIIETRFPDYANSFKGKISETRDLGYGTAGMYTPKTGEIKISARQGYNTPQVMDMVQTMLHEMYHAQSHTPEAIKNSNAGDTTLMRNNGTVGQYTPEYAAARNALVTGADTGNFPSVDASRWHDNIGEFLAEATSIKVMDERNVTPPKRYNYDELMKNPDIADFVGRATRPDLPTLKAPPKSFTDAVSDLFSNLLK